MNIEMTEERQLQLIMKAEKMLYSDDEDEQLIGIAALIKYGKGIIYE